jgi:hypothetical protein
MAYGIPESALTALEKENTNQFYKCVDCAIDGLDEIINSVYIVEGTVLCLRHAKEARGIKTKSSYSDPNTGPAGDGYFTLV